VSCIIEGPNIAAGFTVCAFYFPKDLLTAFGLNSGEDRGRVAVQCCVVQRSAGSVLYCPFGSESVILFSSVRRRMRHCSLFNPSYPLSRTIPAASCR
jgi:hypothetical protein